MGSQKGKPKPDGYWEKWSEARKGHPVSEETRKKISESLKGRPLTEEHCQKIRKAAANNPNWGMRGKTMSDESRQKSSESHKQYFETHENPMKGRKHTDESRAKMSVSHKGKPNNWEGRRHTDSAKQKVREAKLGKKLSPEHIEKMRQTRIGHVTPEETRRKISESLMGHPGLKGENNPLWKGGISFEPYTSAFNGSLKDMIRERDGWACQCCGKIQAKLNRKLSVHHIDYDKKNCNPSNLAALCCSCNTRANHNRDLWEEFFVSLLVKRGIRG